MFDGLSTELMGAAIYDLGKAIIDRGTQTEWVQTTLKKWNLAGEQHDFTARYLGTLVQLRLQGKPAATLNLFREADIRRCFYNFYYGEAAQRGNESVHHSAMNDCIEALRVGDEAKAAALDVAAEVEHFWREFRQQVQESRTVKEAELMQKMEELKTSAVDAATLLRQIDQWLQQKNAENIELAGKTHAINSDAAQKALTQHAEKIFNIGKIETAHFHIYGGQKIPRALTKHPFLSDVFLGREDDIKAIKDKLFSGDNLLLLVNGQGGVGKTSIAAKYYDRFHAEYAHTAWVLSERSIASALLLNLATPLGLSFAANAPETERLDALLRAMADLHKPCLLVIDNANEVDDLERNYLLLRRCSNFHLLLTSRITHFEQAARHAIQGLPEAEALELFKRYYPKLQAAEEAIFTQIHAAVGGNTLVVEVLAKNLALFHGIRQQYSLAQLLADLQTEGLLALSKSQAVKVGYQAKDVLRSETPEAIIAAMYDLGELGRAETALLSIFAVLPAESIGFDTLESLLPDAADLEQNALNLAQRGWIDYDEPNASFKCNPVVQEITRKKNELLRDDCAALISGLNDKLERDVIHLDNYQQAGLCARYGESVLNAFGTPDWSLNVLCDGMGYYYKEVGALDKALFIYERQRVLVEKLLEAAPQDEDLINSLATTFSWLGETHRALGNLEKALTFFEQYFELSKELYDSHPQNVAFKNGLAVSYSKLGQTHSALGDLEKALTFFEDFTRILEELYDSYPQNVSFKNGLAISYSKLGETHSALGDLEKALTFFEERSRLGKELYDSYPQNVAFKNGLAISYEKLGETHSALGNLEKALTFFEQYFELSKELYASSPQNVAFKKGLAISYSKLGETHSALGNLEKALTFFEQDIELSKELYESSPQNVAFKNGLAVSYSKLGETHSALGNLEKALTFFEERSRLGKELYDSFPQNVAFKNGLAISYERLGDTHSALGNLEKALTFFEDETALFEELYASSPQNVGFKNGLAISYSKLGATHSALGDLEKALTFFEQDIELSKELYASSPQNVGFKNGLAISYYKLAALNRDHLNNKVKAQSYFRQAETLWQELVRDAPQYVQFQRFLGIVQRDLSALG